MRPASRLQRPPDSVREGNDRGAHPTFHRLDTGSEAELDDGTGVLTIVCWVVATFRESRLGKRSSSGAGSRHRGCTKDLQPLVSTGLTVSRD